MPQQYCWHASSRRDERVLIFPYCQSQQTSSLAPALLLTISINHNGTRPFRRRVRHNRATHLHPSLGPHVKRRNRRQSHQRSIPKDHACNP